MSGRSNGKGLRNVEPFPEEWTDSAAVIEWIQNDIETWREAGYTIEEYGEANGLSRSWLTRIRAGDVGIGTRTFAAFGAEMEKFGRKVRGRR